MNYRRFAGLLALVFVLTPSNASAQSPRDGFYIGLGLGAGSFGVEGEGDREWAATGSFKLGGAISENALLGIESFAWVKEENGSDITQATGAIVVHLYPEAGSGLFLKAGFGRTTLELVSDWGWRIHRVEEEGNALIAGIGFDSYTGGSFAVTPFGNFIHTRYDGGSTTLLQVGVGFNWY